jgi:hypothetical protein
MSTNKSLFTLATVAALSLLGAGSAMAAGEFLDAPAATVSTTSRSAVQAELLAARSNGSLAAPGEGLAASNTVLQASASRDRAAVIAELQAARAAGSLVAAGEGLAAEHVPAARSAQRSSTVAQGVTTITQ